MATRRRSTVPDGQGAQAAKVAQTGAMVADSKPATISAERGGRSTKPKATTSLSAPAILKVVDPAVFTTGTPGKAPSQGEVSEAARVIRAQKELLQRSELRLIYQATRSKTPQSAIAALLGTSQPTISRIATKIEENPSILEPSPSEVINRHAAGQISRVAMMKALLSFSYTPGRYDPTGGDGFLRGNWRQIEEALTAGYITDEEYEQIAREAPAAKPARAAR